MAQTVIGMFDNESQAQRAVEQLMDRGFTRDNIDLATRHTGTTTDSTSTTTRRDDDNDNFGDSISNFFSSLFGGDDSDRYTEMARRGGTVVTVHARSPEEAERAADILDDYGAVDINDRSFEYNNNVMGDTDNTVNSDRNFVAGTTMGTTTGMDLDSDLDRTDNTRMFSDQDRLTTDENRSIPIIEEQLNVGKREVTTGGVRLRSRIIERPVEENLRLRQEHVRVERNPVNRPATEADLNAFQEGEIEMTEHGERAVVGKEARIVEEVSLHKEVEERVETVRDTVRRTDVEVENLGTDDVNYRSGTTNLSGTGTTDTYRSDDANYQSGTTDYRSDDDDLTNDRNRLL